MKILVIANGKGGVGKNNYNRQYRRHPFRRTEDPGGRLQIRKEVFPGGLNGARCHMIYPRKTDPKLLKQLRQVKGYETGRGRHATGAQV